MSIEEITDDFAFLDDWEDRYRYVIELGRGLAPLGQDRRTEVNRVRGCASQVWLATQVTPDGPNGGPVLNFTGASDAMIVSGLIAILFAIYDNKSPKEISAIDAEAIFTQLGLKEHLTRQRANGLVSMVERIRRDAAQAAETAEAAGTGT